VKLHEYIAHAIMHGRTQKHFTSLQADFLQLEQQIMSDINSNLNVQSSAVPAPIAKPVDAKDLITGEDNRQESAQGNTSALRGNDSAVRSETEGGA
jgi:hypothetical protein